jgi:hypothetical protein
MFKLACLPAKNKSGLALDLFVSIFTLKIKYMKKNSKMIRVMLTTLLILFMNQVTLFARSNDYSASDSGLSPVQIIGAVGLVLLAIVLPLVRGSRKEASHK